MLPEVGASELIVLAAVALIVVGPKDLPVLLRKVGQFLAKLRGFAADFRQSFDEMARQSELDDLRKEVEALRNSSNFTDTGNATPTWEQQQVDYAAIGADQPEYPILPPSDAVAEPATPVAADPAPKPKRTRKPKAAAAASEGEA